MLFKDCNFLFGGREVMERETPGLKLKLRFELAYAIFFFNSYLNFKFVFFPFYTLLYKKIISWL